MHHTLHALYMHNTMTISLQPLLFRVTCHYNFCQNAKVNTSSHLIVVPIKASLTEILRFSSTLQECQTTAGVTFAFH